MPDAAGPDTTVTVITDAAREVPGAVTDAAGAGATSRILVDAEYLEEATGWALEDRGLCRGDVCVPVSDRDALLDGGRVDMAALGAALHQPVVVDPGAGVAALGERAETRADALVSLQAPEVTLPGLDGEPLVLPGERGKKKLLVAWASW